MNINEEIQDVNVKVDYSSTRIEKRQLRGTRG
jgi:hypothetical protein